MPVMLVHYHSPSHCFKFFLYALTLFSFTTSLPFEKQSTLLLRVGTLDGRGQNRTNTLTRAYLDEVSNTGGILSSLDLTAASGILLPLGELWLTALTRAADTATVVFVAWAGGIEGALVGSVDSGNTVLVRVDAYGTVIATPFSVVGSKYPLCACSLGNGGFSWIAGVDVDPSTTTTTTTTTTLASVGKDGSTALLYDGISLNPLSGPLPNAVACDIISGQLWAGSTTSSIVAAVGWGYPKGGTPGGAGVAHSLIGVNVISLRSFVFESPLSLWVCDGGALPNGFGLAHFTRPLGGSWSLSDSGHTPDRSPLLSTPCVDVAINFDTKTGAVTVFAVSGLTTTVYTPRLIAYTPSKNTVRIVTSFPRVSSAVYFRGVAPAPAVSPIVAGGHLFLTQVDSGDGGDDFRQNITKGLRRISLLEISSVDGTIVNTVTLPLAGEGFDSQWGTHGGSLVPTTDGTSILLTGYSIANTSTITSAVSLGDSLSSPPPPRSVYTLTPSPRTVTLSFSSAAAFSTGPFFSACGDAGGRIWMNGVGDGGVRGGLLFSADGVSMRSVLDANIALGTSACVAIPRGNGVLAVIGVSAAAGVFAVGGTSAPTSIHSPATNLNFSIGPGHGGALVFIDDSDSIVYIAEACGGGPFPPCSKNAPPAGVNKYLRDSQGVWSFARNFVGIPVLGLTSGKNFQGITVLYATAFDPHVETSTPTTIGGPTFLLCIEPDSGHVDIVTSVSGGNHQWRGVAMFSSSSSLTGVVSRNPFQVFEPGSGGGGVPSPSPGPPPPAEPLSSTTAAILGGTFAAVFFMCCCGTKCLRVLLRMPFCKRTCLGRTLSRTTLLSNFTRGANDWMWGSGTKRKEPTYNDDDDDDGGGLETSTIDAHVHDEAPLTGEGEGERTEKGSTIELPGTTPLNFSIEEEDDGNNGGEKVAVAPAAATSISSMTLDSARLLNVKRLGGRLV